MSGVIKKVFFVVRADAKPLLLALLLHALLILALLTTKIPQRAQAPVSEPVMSYLYQPPPPVYADTAAQPVAETALQPEEVNAVPAHSAVPVAQTAVSQPDTDAESLPDIAGTQKPVKSAPPMTSPRQSLVQRALNRASAVEPAQIEQAATTSYQQLMQAQQQPKLTVKKRHQQLDQDPAGQVVATLNNGRQLIRTKGGCRLADPSKEGFEALMAANAVVPCGDEEHSSALLKQALEKHVKR